MAAFMFTHWLVPEGLAVESMTREAASPSPPALPKATRFVRPAAVDRDGSTAAA
jgi:hypothetical protein